MKKLLVGLLVVGMVLFGSVVANAGWIGFTGSLGTATGSTTPYSTVVTGQNYVNYSSAQNVGNNSVFKNGIIAGGTGNFSQSYNRTYVTSGGYTVKQSGSINAYSIPGMKGSIVTSTASSSVSK
jgi:hypothetical protein